ncbi:GH25 family lysozyme [Agrobacterium tumefaciens]|uniref:glycoside hydrolase family 25 protein n=1 Tax=Agrobacterium tumefaciens TaxID=358 RepID=UPI00287E34FF|nr:GH25 family lysozyme [Agrobacterium tumefaciens]MDS7597555.1 glycoside hydrolase family 25 protein [Agrobacterium tumefaciens]
MRLRLSAILSALLLASGCTSTSYDLLETASVAKPKFADTDPQDFGHNNPHRHEVHGIDVSKWNGSVDWQTVRKSGVSFVFVKATEGSDRIDPKFDDHWRNAASAGIAHAPYHFYYFCSTADSQADWFIRNVPKGAVTLPPVLDVEWNPASPTCKTRPAPAVVRVEMQRFLDRIEAHYGKRPIIYTSVDFHRDNLVGQFKNYHFWVRSVAAHPAKIYEDRQWAFWQYTATGVVPGVSGPTDINVFAGTEKNWRKWVAEANKNG